MTMKRTNVNGKARKKKWLLKIYEYERNRKRLGEIKHARDSTHTAAANELERRRRRGVYNQHKEVIESKKRKNNRENAPHPH